MEEKEVKDFWGRHNLSSRIGFFIFLITYIITILYGLFSKNPNFEIIKTIITNVSLFAFLSLSMIILGPNTFVEAVKYWRCGKNENENTKMNENNFDEKLPKV